MKATKTQKTIYKMLTESTGITMCDPGGEDNRGWQKDQKITIKDFMNEPEVLFDSDDNYETVSLFHHLSNHLSLNETCDKFNSMPVNNWDSDKFYGLSLSGEDFLHVREAKISDSFNSYNGESNLSQVIQFAYVTIQDEKYILLQTHNGCDVRGGYTDAKLFLLDDDYIDTNPTVYGSVKRGEVYFDVSTGYGGYHLTCDDDGNKEYEYQQGDEVSLSV